METLLMLDLELARLVAGCGDGNNAREIAGRVEARAVKYGLDDTARIAHNIANCKCLHSRQADAFRADLRMVYPEFF